MSQDGLENLENLNTLNVAGNLIESIDEFKRLEKLPSLFHLTISDQSLLATNPLCKKNINYQCDVKKFLPQLQTLDGFKNNNLYIQGYFFVLSGF